jgi:hypothetical protein
MLHREVLVALTLLDLPVQVGFPLLPPLQRPQQRLHQPRPLEQAQVPTTTNLTPASFHTHTRSLNLAPNPSPCPKPNPKPTPPVLILIPTLTPALLPTHNIPLIIAIISALLLPPDLLRKMTTNPHA